MAATETIDLLVSGILFDSDGTLIDSTPAVSRFLRAWCQRQSLDPRVLAVDPLIHGVRTKDVLRKHQRVPTKGSETKEEDLEAEAKKVEQEVLATGGFCPGLESVGFENFGIVTSGGQDFVISALKLAGIKHIPFVISGEQTLRGKPSPEPFLAGLQVLETRIATKLDPSTVLVVEDSPAGIASGLAAGCQVITVCTGPVKEAESVKIARTNSDGIHVVRDLTQVEVVGIEEGKLKLRIKPVDLSLDRSEIRL